MCVVIIFFTWLQYWLPEKNRRFWNKEYRCQWGFTLSSAECTDFDECETGIKFCRDLHCINTVGSYTCGCTQGFEVVEKRYETYCEDVDECSNRNSCPDKASCKNTIGSYECLCDDGYEGEFCTDVDECSGTIIHCDTNAYCLNTLGSDDLL